MAPSTLLKALLAITFLAFMVAADSATVAQRNEKRVLDCTLESKSFSDCDPMHYVIRVVVFAAPGAVIAVFLLLACPFYCSFKYCCNCCGGRNQTPNFCCPNTDLAARYSRGDILRPKVIAVLCGLGVIAAVIWGLVGGNGVITGLIDLGDTVKGIPNILQDQIDDIEQALVIQQYSRTTGFSNTSLFDTTADGNATKSKAEDVKKELNDMIAKYLGTYRDYINKGAVAVWALFLVPGVIVLQGTLASLLNCRRFYPMTLVWLLFIFGFIVWICHMLFSGLSMLMGDFCAEVEGLTNKQLNLIPILAHCTDSIFSGFKSNFRSLEVTQASSTCTSILTYCYRSGSSVQTNVNNGWIYNCPTSITCTGMTFAILVNYMETSFFTHPNIVAYAGALQQGLVCKDPTKRNSCTIKACADDVTGCLLPNGQLSNFGQNSKELYYNFLGAKTVSNAIDTTGARFSTCDSVMSLIVSPFNSPCQKISSNMVVDRQATGFLGLIIIASIFVFAWGAKRFIALDQADVAQNEDSNKVEELQ